MSRIRTFFNSRYFVYLSVILAASTCLFLIAFSSYKIKDLKTQYSFRDFFPKKHELLESEEKFIKKFQLEEASPFLVALTLPKDSKNKIGWLNKDSIKILSHITEALSQLPKVAKVTSLANIEMANLGQSDIQIGPALLGQPEKNWPSWVKNQNLIRSQLISDDFRSVLILVEPSSKQTQDQQHLAKRIDLLLQKTLPEKMKIQTNIGGAPAIQARMSSQLENELKKFLLISLSLFCALMFLFYKTYTPVLLTLVGLIASNLTALAGLAVAQVSFSILLSTLPIIVSTTFISMVLHSLHRWAELLKLNRCENWHERQLLVFKMLQEMFLPNLLGSVTTAVGFLTLASTVIPAIQNYAITVGCVVMWTWFFGQFVLFLSLPWLNPQPRKWNQSRATWMIPVLRLSIPIVSLVLAVAIVSGSSVAKLNFSTKLFDDLPDGDSARFATEKIDAKFGGALPLNLFIEQKNQFWKSSDSVSELNRLVTDIRKISGVGSSLSVADFITEKNRQTTAQLAEQYFLFSMSAENPLKNFISNDESTARIAIRLHDLPSAEIYRLQDKIRSLAEVRFSEAKIFQTGAAVLTHQLNQSLSQELVFGFWQSLALIGLMLGFVFKSARWALVACLPNLVPPAILMGALAITQTPVKPGIALIFSIALGLAFNNTVYLLSRLKRIQKEHKMKHLPLKRALLMEGNPCLTESFVLFVGFLSFLLSKFQLNQTFGIFMLISIFAGFVGDLVFLPAILKEFPNWLHEPQEKKSFFQFLKQKRAQMNKHKLRIIENKEVAVSKNKDYSSNHFDKVAGFIFCIFLFQSFDAAQALNSGAHQKQSKVNTALTAEKILKTMRLRLQAKTDSANISLNIIEKNGEVKNREMHLQSLRTKLGAKVLVRIQSPSDVKGTALLADIQKKQQLQWIYLPSSKQVRRITGGATQGGILGSELSAQDLNPEAISNAKAKMQSQDQQTYLLQISLKGKASPYTHMLMQISKKDFVPLVADYYRGKILVKQVSFLEYTKFGNVFRAQKIKVVNKTNGRATDVVLKDIQVNQPIKESQFTPESLKDDF